MKHIKFLLFSILCTFGLMGCVVTSETVHVRSANVYDPYVQRPVYGYGAQPYGYRDPWYGYGAQQYGYGAQNYYHPSKPKPVYATPSGVSRPERFACGADVFTGAYNCVPRRKAHFVRPLGYTY